jgi:hypothetical protein
MDFFVNAVGDVFAWVFLISVALAALTLLASLISFLILVPPAGVGFLLLMFQAILLALFGLAGDYIQRIYRQSSGRPFYLVRRIHEPEPAR